MGKSRSRHLQSWQQGLSHYCGLFLQFLVNWQAQRYQSIHMCTKAEESLCKKRHSWCCNLRQRTTIHLFRVRSVWKRMGLWVQDKQSWSSTGKWPGWICCQDSQEHPQEGKEKQKWHLPHNTCSTKHPYRIYGFKSSTKTAGKMHQNPTAHNSWTPQTTACQHRGHQQANQNAQQKQKHYYNRKARHLPPLQEGDVVRMRPFTLNGKTWDKAMVAKRLDERSYLVATSYRRNRVDLRKHKKWGNQIPVASKDMKSTQEMAVRNPNPYASWTLCHRLTTRNLVPYKWQLHHHVVRNRSWDALTNQSAWHPCQDRLKPDLGELSVSRHTWRTI